PRRSSDLTLARSKAIRPTSNATVVVDVDSTPSKSSTPTLSEVITSSVCNDSTSLNADTNVVLPAPNPPATTIFNVSGTGPATSVDICTIHSPSQLTDTFQDRTQRRRIRPSTLPVRGMHHDASLIQQIRQQDPHHPQRKIRPGSDFGNRNRTHTQRHDQLQLRIHIQRLHRRYSHHLRGHRKIRT